jgi:hypothetical protein
VPQADATRSKSRERRRTEVVIMAAMFQHAEYSKEKVKDSR